MVEHERLEDCWEIMKCGQGKDHGRDASPEYCPAKQQGMGHSCWVIEGVLGGDSFFIGSCQWSTGKLYHL